MRSLTRVNGVDSVSTLRSPGHAQVPATANIYAHVTEAADRKDAGILAGVLLNQKRADDF